MEKKNNKWMVYSESNGAGIALGLFSLGLALIIITAMILFEVFLSILSIVILIISFILIAIVVFLLWKLVKGKKFIHRKKHSD
ncbi:hypothetical protein WAK64_09410 [Bacillus spongiae]|uniref:ABC transporter ATP-binding protein n=1 Tax=Bacillus spongiae TaxID=2683610 RepID=A0ABU8HDK3_9BACI